VEVEVEVEVVVVCPPTQVSIPLAARKIMIVSSFNCT
jgi:hypothetical protein